MAGAAAELLAKARPEDGAVGLLVAEQVRGARELIAGLVRDPQFGPCVMLGVGGVLAEALRDVVFASVPLDEASARALPDRLATRALLGAFRGEPAIDRDALARVLLGLSRLALERPDVASVDLNPLIVRGGVPLAVDALVELEPRARAAAAPPRARVSDAEVLERFRPLFHPRGIIVAGASTHPGKFGFVTLHNLRRFGYAGRSVRGEPRRRGRARPADRADDRRGAGRRRRPRVRVHAEPGQRGAPARVREEGRARGVRRERRLRRGGRGRAARSSASSSRSRTRSASCSRARTGRA